MLDGLDKAVAELKTTVQALQERVGALESELAEARRPTDSLLASPRKTLDERIDHEVGRLQAQISNVHRSI